MIEELSWKLECWWREYWSCHIFGRKHEWADWVVNIGFPSVSKVAGRYCKKCDTTEEGKFVENHNGLVKRV